MGKRPLVKTVGVRAWISKYISIGHMGVIISLYLNPV